MFALPGRPSNGGKNIYIERERDRWIAMFALLRRPSSECMYIWASILIDVCMYVYMYMYMSVYVYVYIYTWCMYRERQSDRWINMFAPPGRPSNAGTYMWAPIIIDVCM